MTKRHTANRNLQGRSRLPLVIAHRGASGYLPEHTLEAIAMAHALDADFLESDVVLTKDNVPIVMHDIHLEYTTDVREVFPKKRRKDGHWYAIDFTLAEIKTLNAHERVDEQGHAVYPKRFPLKTASFKVPTLTEHIELIQGLNKSTGENKGLYPELKEPEFHTKAGYDIGKTVLDLLKHYGYSDKNANLFLQCFDPDYLKRLFFELGCLLPLIQLIGPNEWKGDPDCKKMLSKAGLKEIARYAKGIGMWLYQIQDEPNHRPSYVVNPTIVEDAHEVGLLVHVYTFRKDELPSYVQSFSELLNLFCTKWKVDGVFTDFAFTRYSQGRHY